MTRTAVRAQSSQNGVAGVSIPALLSPLAGVGISRGQRIQIHRKTAKEEGKRDKEKGGKYYLFPFPFLQITVVIPSAKITG